jgi:uncharacterized membrane protein
MTAKVKDNPFMKFFPLVFPIFVGLMTWYGGYKILETQVADLREKMKNPLSMEDVRKIIKDEILEMNEKLAAHIQDNRDTRTEVFGRFVIIENRVQTIEKSLYHKKIL